MIDENSIVKKCEQIVAEIEQFGSDEYVLGKPTDNCTFHKFENKINYKLPFEFVALMSRINGFNIQGSEVYSLDSHLSTSLDRVYEFEHKNDDTMPAWYLPFSNDGRGNHYCLDLLNQHCGLCNVIFWQYDLMYAPDYSDIETCHSSFLDWVLEVAIEWNRS